MGGFFLPYKVSLWILILNPVFHASWTKHHSCFPPTFFSFLWQSTWPWGSKLSFGMFVPILAHSHAINSLSYMCCLDKWINPEVKFWMEPGGFCWLHETEWSILSPLQFLFYQSMQPPTKVHNLGSHLSSWTVFDYNFTSHKSHSIISKT